MRKSISTSVQVLFMRVNGMETLGTDMVKCYGKMGLYMRVNLNTEGQLVMVNSFTFRGSSMRATGT